MNAVFWYLATQCLAELRRQEEEEYDISANESHPVTISEYILMHNFEREHQDK